MNHNCKNRGDVQTSLQIAIPGDIITFGSFQLQVGLRIDERKVIREKRVKSHYRGIPCLPSPPKVIKIF